MKPTLVLNLLAVSFVVQFTASLGCSGSGGEGDARDEASSPEGDLRLEVEEIKVEAEEQVSDLDDMDIAGEADDYRPEAVFELPPCAALEKMPVVAICDPGCVVCTQVEEIDIPYVRGTINVRASVGCPVEPGLKLSVDVGGEKRVCIGAANCDLEIASASLHTESALIKVTAEWPDGFSGSWSRVLPVYDCDIPSGRTFCLKFGDWYEQTLPDFNDAAVTNFDAELTKQGGIDVVAIVAAWDGNGVHTDRIVRKTWNGAKWSGPYFPDVVYSPFAGVDLVERTIGGAEAFAQVFAGDLPDLGILELGSPPEVSVVMTRDLLATCLQDAMNLAFGWNVSPGSVEPAAIAYGLAGSTRYAIVDGAKLGDQILVTDDSGNWTCQPLSPMLANVVPSVEGWPQTADSHWPGFCVPDAFTDATGKLRMVFESDSGLPVLATKTEGQAWSFLALPSAGTTIPSPVEPLPAGAVERIGTVYVVRPGLGSEVTVLRLLYEVPTPAVAPALSRFRVSDAAVESYDDLSEVVSAMCAASLLPGSSPAQAGDEIVCRTGTLDSATDACGRTHGLLAGPSGWSEYEGWRAWPSMLFDNLAGEWTGEPIPEIGIIEGGFRLLITPDGAEHLLAKTSPVPPPYASLEGWSAGFRLRHWIRPCAVPFSE